MASRKGVLGVVFKGYGNTDGVLYIVRKLSVYKAPIQIWTRRGDSYLETRLSASTIIKLFNDFEVKHQTEKRIVLKKE